VVDGDVTSWSVLDPLEGASLMIKLTAPVTVERFGIWLTISSRLSVAKGVVLIGDGKELVQASLESKKGRQEIAP